MSRMYMCVKKYNFPLGGTVEVGEKFKQIGSDSSISFYIFNLDKTYGCNISGFVFWDYFVEITHLSVLLELQEKLDIMCSEVDEEVGFYESSPNKHFILKEKIDAWIEEKFKELIKDN